MAGAFGRVILVAEDEENDFFLLQWAFAKHDQKITLHRVADGVQAIDYLEGNGPYANRRKYPLPDLLVVDLKMPRKDGFDVLEWLHGREAFHSMVVVVLSSSRQDQDVKRAYKLGANSFLTKPNDTVGLSNMTRVLVDFWFRWSQIPERGQD